MSNWRKYLAERQKDREKKKSRYSVGMLGGVAAARAAKSLAGPRPQQLSVNQSVEGISNWLKRQEQANQWK